jgi:hypothetical protein
MTTSNDEIELLRELFTDEPPPDAHAWTAMLQRLAIATAHETTGDMKHHEPQSRGQRLRSLPRRRILGAAAAFILLVAGTLAVLGSTHSPRSPRTPSTISSTPWRLASMVATAAPFVATSTTAQSPDQISCPSVSVCYVTTRVFEPTPGQAAGAQTSSIPSAYVSTDAGSSWQALVMPPGVVLDTAFSCPTVAECMVGAQEGQVPSNGLSVGDQMVANSEPQLLLTTTDGGMTWSEHSVPIPPVLGNDPAFDAELSGTSGELSQVTCFDASTCDAFGLAPSDQEEEPIGTGNTVERNVFLQTTDGGATWSTYDFPWVANPDGSPGWSNVQVAAFSCPTAQDCVGMSTVVTSVVNNTQVMTDFSWATTDGGTTWNRAWVPSVGGTQSLVRSMACADTTHCIAVGSYTDATPGSTSSSFIAVTSNSGSTWIVEPPSSGSGALILSVNCADVQECWAVGTSDNSTSGVMITTSDGGMSWDPVQVPALAGIDGIDCLASASCYAIGYGTFGPGTPSTEVITNAMGGSSAGSD